jgi:hypothetical protein
MAGRYDTPVIAYTKTPRNGRMITKASQPPGIIS